MANYFKSLFTGMLITLYQFKPGRVSGKARIYSSKTAIKR